MFFRKKKEKPKRDVYEELSRKWGLPKEAVENIGYVYANAGRGLIKILKSVDPENTEKYAWNALDVEDRGDYIYIRGIKKSEYFERGLDENHPNGVHYPIIHGFLTLAIARKLGNTNPAIGHVVGKALSMWLSRGGYPDIKKNPDEFVELLAKILQNRGMYVDDGVKKTIREALEKSTKIADKLIPDVSSVRHLDATSRAIANDAEDPFQILQNAGIDIEPELEEFRQFLAEISGKKIEPEKPKYPETKNAVEEELRKAGVPEEKVKIVAPRLATAVWLDKWFENAAKSYTYKKLGGVPLDEIKNLRNMILAKKHLAEVAAKIMEEHWTRGNHVQITEEHVDPKLLPLVREHAQGMFEDLENIRKRVKEGKMSVEEAINLMNVERNLLDMAHEHVERLMGSPEHLAKNPRPLGPEDEYVVKLSSIMKAHRKLKPHLEKARPVILKKE